MDDLYKISRIVGDWAGYDKNAAQILADDNNGINLRSYLTEDRYHYILRDGQVVYAGLFDSAEFFESDGRQIDETNVGEIRVSTVFLSFDHGRLPPFHERAERYSPTLFETMVFGGVHDEYQRRYTSFDEAKQGHLETVEMVRHDG